MMKLWKRRWIVCYFFKSSWTEVKSCLEVGTVDLRVKLMILLNPADYLNTVTETERGSLQFSLHSTVNDCVD